MLCNRNQSHATITHAKSAHKTWLLQAAFVSCPSQADGTSSITGSQPTIDIVSGSLNKHRPSCEFHTSHKLHKQSCRVISQQITVVTSVPSLLRFNLPPGPITKKRWKSRRPQPMETYPEPQVLASGLIQTLLL